jgi:hypothetical protein
MINLNTILIAIIGAAGAVISAFAGNRRRQIHNLVNGNVTALRNEVQRLTGLLTETTGALNDTNTLAAAAAEQATAAADQAARLAVTTPPTL